MKVLLFQVFDRQKVIQIDEEPIHICSSGQGSSLFLVCLKSGKINIYSAEHEVPLIYSFTTQNENVISLAYAQEYGIAVTIEPEDALSAINVVRVYRLPLIPELEPYATHVKKSSSLHDDYSFQVYQLPLHASVNAIAVCTKTGRIAAATNTDISVWNPVHDSSDSNNGGGNGNGRGYEKMFQIETLSVRNIAIHGSYLAYCTNDTVSVFECRVSMINKDAVSKEVLPKVRLNGGPLHVATGDYTVEISSHNDVTTSNVLIPW